MTPRVETRYAPESREAEQSRRGSFGFVYAAWVLAFVAALASLFFGEVMGLPICTLCWYQRICLFPLVILLPVALVLRDRHVTYYTVPLVSIGLAIAAYHNLLYYGVISEGIMPCTGAIPCTVRQIEWMGFITIPLMALGAFGAILACLVIYRIQAKEAR